MSLPNIRLPGAHLVLLIGASGSGKSSFARRHFSDTEIVSSDRCRAMISDDENDQTATDDAFAILHDLVDKRLRRRLLTVVDATNLEAPHRATLLSIARRRHLPTMAVVLRVPQDVLRSRLRGRTDRQFGPDVLDRQVLLLRQTTDQIRNERFGAVHLLDGAEAIQTTRVERVRADHDRRDLAGPFDIVGDVHGCLSELHELLEVLGWRRDNNNASHPHGRRLVFVGDLVDRGPNVAGVLELAMNMVERGTALCVVGNHDDKLLRYLRGRRVEVTPALAASVAAISERGAEFVRRVTEFLAQLPSHLLLADEQLVVAHAGLLGKLHGRQSKRVRAFCLYGQTSGARDDYGLPIREDWGADYEDAADVVHGHTPVSTTRWVNRTLCLDTGCVFGGKLTAVRWPERELRSVPAAQTWFDPVKPLQPR